MLRPIAPLILTGLASSAVAQFVYPKPEYNRPTPGLYYEDPFIVEYRRKFFAVFRGDVATFDKAFSEIEAMVEKDPKDARALVWLGNGQTVRGGLLNLRGKRTESLALLAASRRTLDRAVALRPKDPNIYMMRPRPSISRASTGHPPTFRGKTGSTCAKTASGSLATSAKLECR